MSKKVAVLAVNPVNGSGLFQYLETFFEKGISYKVFAVSDTKTIRTNSGIPLEADDIIAHLSGHSDEFDALVFSCGDAVPVFQNNATQPYNVDLLKVIQEFATKKKIMAGHCAAGLIFEIAAIQKGIATDEPAVIDDNFYTAQCEHTLPVLMPRLVEALA